MAKSTLETATQWVVLALLVFLALVFGLLFLAVFAPIVAYFLFRYSDRIKDLEARLAKYEKPKDAKT